MATTNTSLAELENNGSASAVDSGLSTEKSTVRAYYKFTPVLDKNKEQVKDEKGNPVFNLKIQAKAESANKENWKKLEEEGFQLLNENDVVRYNCKTEEATKILVEDPSQRTYLFQSGVNYVQNSKINLYAVSIKEGTGTSPDNPPVPEHNGEEYDLKAAINEKPGRRGLTQMEKLDKMLEQMGMDKDARALFLRNAAASYEAAKAAGTVPVETEEEEGEEETASV